MSDNNTMLGRAVDGYRSVFSKPWHAALATGGLAALIGAVGWHPIMSTLRSLGRAPAKLVGIPAHEYYQGMEEIEHGKAYRYGLPLAFGAAAALAHLAAMDEPDRVRHGLTDWNAPLKKSAAFDDHNNYIRPVDFSVLVSRREANDLFAGDPFLTQPQNSYTRQLGTAIVNDAANRAGSSRMTLGNVFDSAVDKIDKKLSFTGALNVGARTVLANQTATMFVSALGSMTGMSPETRRNIIDTGTWAGAVNAILS